MQVPVNMFAPTSPHEKQRLILDDPSRFKIVRAGRKFRKTSLMISWLFENAILTPKTVHPYIAPNRIQAKNIAWDDHVARVLDELRSKKVPHQVNETELSVTFPHGGKVQLLGVENKEALRGISNWGSLGCFVGNTEVLTINGWKKISLIRVGELLITPYGNRKVTGKKKIYTKKTQAIRLSNGRIIEATRDHKVFTDNGLVRFDELSYYSPIWTTTYHRLLNIKGLSIGLKNAVRYISGQEQINKQDIFTGKYGEINTEKFQKDLSYTTKIEIRSITIFQILSVLLLTNIQVTIQNIGLEKILKLLWIGLRNQFLNLLHIQDQLKVDFRLVRQLNVLVHYLKRGIAVKRERNGTLREEKKTGRIGYIHQKIVNYVLKNIEHHIQKGQCSVLSIVGINSIEYKKRIPVYDLTVEHDHCYFANSLLVSNCDEYDDWTEDIWPTIIRPNLMVHKAPAMISGTPKGFRNMYRLSQRSEFKEFHFTSFDNPDLDREELDAMVEEYKDEGEDYYRQEILAEYVKPVGVVYKEWAMNNFKEIEYDVSLPLYVTFDWGVNDPTVVIWLQMNGSELRVIDYYEAKDANIEHFVSVINAKPYKKPDMFCGDPAGKARTLTTGTSPIEMLSQKGIYVKTTDGVTIEEQVRISHTFIPSLFISTKADRFRECILNYRYPTMGVEKRSKLNFENEVPIHDEFSHAMRAFEYFCVNIRGVVARPVYKQPSRGPLVYGRR